MRIALVISFALLTPLHAAVPAVPFDLLIRNARIVDGSGNPWFAGVLGIRGEEIAAVGRELSGDEASGARRVIDAKGQILAPGFLDLHTHARRGIFRTPTAENYIRQGVTTIFEGPDGGSALPIGAFLDEVEQADIVPNFATFVGQGTVRQAVMGRADRPATPAELERMKALVRQAMEDGAFGLSTGLLYIPGNFTPTAEVVELARVAGGMGGIHTSHMRDEAAKLLDSVRETIRIGEEGGLPTQITHGKAMGKRNWGKSAGMIELVHEARRRGVDVSIDQYPYTASSTGIDVLFPRWALEGDREARMARLQDPATRARIRESIVENLKEDRGGGNLRNVQIASAGWDPSLAGKTLEDLTRAWKGTTTFEDAADLVMEIVEKGGASGIYHAMAEEDVERILRDPVTMVASDGEVPAFGVASPHPRSYGTFARVLARYVRERNVLSLEEAIRKMTSLPAQRAGLFDRGLLRPGMKADLVVFDPATVTDKATFTEPHQYAEGFSLVVVNGKIVLEDGTMTGARPGQVLRGPAWAGGGE